VKLYIEGQIIIKLTKFVPQLWHKYTYTIKVIATGSWMRNWCHHRVPHLQDHFCYMVFESCLHRSDKNFSKMSPYMQSLSNALFTANNVKRHSFVARGARNLWIMQTWHIASANILSVARQTIHTSSFPRSDHELGYMVIYPRTWQKIVLKQKRNSLFVSRSIRTKTAMIQIGTVSRHTFIKPFLGIPSHSPKPRYQIRLGNLRQKQ
jgi:hypothetical protein